jgi:hypothetical protein
MGDPEHFPVANGGFVTTNRGMPAYLRRCGGSHPAPHGYRAHICAPVPVARSPVRGAQLPSSMPGNGKIRRAEKAASTMTLSVEESAGLRARLLTDVAGLRSQDSATSWARHSLPLKNTLTADDAKLLEEA